MDIAEANGFALRRWLLSAEHFSDNAILCGSFQVNIPSSRSNALLDSVACCDQYSRCLGDIGFWFFRGLFIFSNTNSTNLSDGSID